MMPFAPTKLSEKSLAHIQAVIAEEALLVLQKHGITAPPEPVDPDAKTIRMTMPGLPPEYCWYVDSLTAASQALEMLMIARRNAEGFKPGLMGASRYREFEHWLEQRKAS